MLYKKIHAKYKFKKSHIKFKYEFLYAVIILKVYKKNHSWRKRYIFFMDTYKIRTTESSSIRRNKHVSRLKDRNVAKDETRKGWSSRRKVHFIFNESVCQSNGSLTPCCLVSTNTIHEFYIDAFALCKLLWTNGDILFKVSLNWRCFFHYA